MVDELCRGLQEGQLMAAFQGLLAMEPHVRNVAVGGIPFIPNLAEGKYSLSIHFSLLDVLLVQRLLASAR